MDAAIMIRAVEAVDCINGASLWDLSEEKDGVESNEYGVCPCVPETLMHVAMHMGIVASKTGKSLTLVAPAMSIHAVAGVVCSLCHAPPTPQHLAMKEGNNSGSMTEALPCNGCGQGR
jgi:hypothetical protein